MAVHRLIILNPNSGDKSLTAASFAAHTATVCTIAEFMDEPNTYLTPTPEKIVIAGGDGTHFSVFCALLQHVPARAELSVLAFGGGTENVAAHILGTVPAEGEAEELVADFFAEKLPQKVLQPFEYAIDDKTSGIGFWSAAAGGIAPMVLRYLEQFRGVEHPGFRQTLATVYFLVRNQKLLTTAAQMSGRRAVHGLDVAFISQDFPLWPKFLDVEKLDESSDTTQNYLLRIGKPGQKKLQFLVGAAIDLFAVQWYGKPVTHTLSVTPATENSITFISAEKQFVIDSELHEAARSDSLTIWQKPRKKMATLQISYRK